VSTGVISRDALNTFIETTTETVDDDETQLSLDGDRSRDEPNERSQQIYVDADRVALPSLADSEFGEHAAAFLSGNFQPLTEELTTSVECGGDLEDDDDLLDVLRAAASPRFSRASSGSTPV